MIIKTTNKIILLFIMAILLIGCITPVLAASSVYVCFYYGGNRDSKSEWYEVGEEIRFPDPGTYRGHEFVGWSEDSTDRRGQYFPGDKYKVTDDDSLFFYAIWHEEQSKRISFYPEGGNKVSDIICYSGETVQMPTTTRSGYKLAGWATVLSDKVKYLPGEKVDADDIRDYTLYAVWEREKSSSSTTTSSSSSTTTSSSSSTSSSYTPPATSYVPSATEITCQIKYDSKGGNTTPETVTAIYGYKIKIADAPTKEGYVFKEWNTKEDGTGDKFIPGEKTYIYYSEEKTLYAIWEEAATISNPVGIIGKLKSKIQQKLTLGEKIFNMFTSNDGSAKGLLGQLTSVVNKGVTATTMITNEAINDVTGIMKTLSNGINQIINGTKTQIKTSGFSSLMTGFRKMFNS